MYDWLLWLDDVWLVTVTRWCMTGYCDYVTLFMMYDWLLWLDDVTLVTVTRWCMTNIGYCD